MASNPFQYQGNGAGFLTDYSPLAAAGEAFKSAVQGYSQAKNDEATRLEKQAQIEAMKTKADRENFQSQMDAAKEGYQKGPNGELQEAPLSPKVQGMNRLKAIGEGVKPTAFDANGNATDYAVDPNSPKMQDIKAKQAMASGRLDITRAGLGTRQDNQSAAAVNSIHNDKVIVPMRQQATNIDKGLDTLAGSPNHKPSWLEVNEVAQDYANALSGAKGSSDFKLKQSEQDSFDKYLGDLKGRASSNPDQPADKTYVDFYTKFGQRLKQTYDKQMASRASNLLAGKQGAYKHNPDAYNAMKEAADLYRTGDWRNQDLGESGQSASPAPQSAPPARGLVPSGMVSGGMVQGGQQQAPAQDPKIAKYAQDNGLDYSHAAQILKARGYNGQ